MEAMTAEQAAEAGKDLDFAKVWAALMRTDEQIAKMSKAVAELSKNIGVDRRMDGRDGRRQTVGKG